MTVARDATRRVEGRPRRRWAVEVLLASLVVAMYLPVLLSEYFYGDEMVYLTDQGLPLLTVKESVRTGRPASVLVMGTVNRLATSGGVEPRTFRLGALLLLVAVAVASFDRLRALTGRAGFSFAASLGLVTLPTFQVHVAYLALAPYLVGVLVSLIPLAGPRTPGRGFMVSTPCFLLAMTFFQAAPTFVGAFVVACCLLWEPARWYRERRWLAGLVAGLAAAMTIYALGYRLASRWLVADVGYEPARRALELLGPGLWSRIEPWLGPRPYLGAFELWNYPWPVQPSLALKETLAALLLAATLALALAAAATWPARPSSGAPGRLGSTAGRIGLVLVVLGLSVAPLVAEGAGRRQHLFVGASSALLVALLAALWRLAEECGRFIALRRPARAVAGTVVAGFLAWNVAGTPASLQRGLVGPAADLYRFVRLSMSEAAEDGARRVVVLPATDRCPGEPCSGFFRRRLQTRHTGLYPSFYVHVAREVGWELAASRVEIAGEAPCAPPGCRRIDFAALRRVSDAPPDVVLVTLDTLRADRLGAYGAADVSTPAFDALAAEGVLFERAAAPMPLTLPSHFSIFTGKHPREHGVLTNGMALPDDQRTLAETFRDRGYRTAAFVAVSLLSPASGADRGFETFSAPADGQRRAERVVPEALAWLGGVRAQQPVFLWVHLFDPHQPYAPGPPWDAEALERSGGRWPSLHWPDFERLAAENGGDVPREVLEQALRLYDGEVEYTDHWLGRLVAGLKKRGRWSDSVAAVAADHGECFENGVYFEHADCLFEGAIRVPMVVLHRGREGAGRRVGGQVSLIDLAPTILAAAGAPPEPGQRGVAHRPGAGAEAGRAVLIQHPIYHSRPAERRRRRQQLIRSVAGDPTRPMLVEGDLLGIVGAGWKYLRGAGREELYRLAPEPDETVDLSGAEPAARATMRRRLAAELERHPARTPAEETLDDELRRTLESLGYL